MKHEVSIGDSIKLGGLDIAIRHDKDRELESQQYYGTYAGSLQEICLSSFQTPQRYSETAMHEFIEGINNTWCNGSLNHDQISSLSRGLHQIFEQLGVRFVK